MREATPDLLQTVVDAKVLKGVERLRALDAVVQAASVKGAGDGKGPIVAKEPAQKPPAEKSPAAPLRQLEFPHQREVDELEGRSAEWDLGKNLGRTEGDALQVVVDKRPENRIARADSLKKLVREVEELGGIKGTKGRVYSPEKFAERIELIEEAIENEVGVENLDKLAAGDPDARNIQLFTEIPRGNVRDKVIDLTIDAWQKQKASARRGAESSPEDLVAGADSLEALVKVFPQLGAMKRPDGTLYTLTNIELEIKAIRNFVKSGDYNKKWLDQVLQKGFRSVHQPIVFENFPKEFGFQDKMIKLIIKLVREHLASKGEKSGDVALEIRDGGSYTGKRGRYHVDRDPNTSRWTVGLVDQSLIFNDYKDEAAVRKFLLDEGVLPSEPHVPEVSQAVDPLMEKLSSVPETSVPRGPNEIAEELAVARQRLEMLEEFGDKAGPGLQKYTLADGTSIAANEIESEILEMVERVKSLEHELGREPLVGIEKRELRDGIVYVDKGGNHYQVTEAEGVWQMTGIKNAMLALTFPTKEEIQKYIAEKGWEITPNAEQEIKPKAEGDAKEAEKGEVDPLAALRQAVEDARKEYVEADFKQMKAWSGVMKFFGDKVLRGGREADNDLVFLKAQYENALLNLKNAALKDWRHSRFDQGLPLNQKMNGIVRLFTFDENEQLDTARMEARVQATEGKVLESVRKGWANIVNGYMKLSFGKKLLYSSAAFGVAGASLLTGGSLAIPAAGVMWGRRFLSGSAAAVGIEGYFEHGAAKNRAAQAEKRVSEYFDEKGNVTPEALKKLDEMLSQDIFQIDTKYQGRKWKSLSRKATAALLGVAVGGSAVWLEKLGVMDWARERFSDGVSALESALPRPTISVPSEGGLPSSISPDGASPPSGIPEPSAPDAPVVSPAPGFDDKVPVLENLASPGTEPITPEAVINPQEYLAVGPGSSIERELIRELRESGMEKTEAGTAAHKAVHAFADIQKLPAESYDLVQPGTGITYHMEGGKLVIDTIDRPEGTGAARPETAQNLHTRGGFTPPSIDLDENILEGTERAFTPDVSMRDFQAAIGRAGIELFGGYDAQGIKNPVKVRDFLGTPVFSITETNTGGRLTPEQAGRVVKFVKTAQEELGVGFNPERGESLAGYVKRIITVAAERGKVGNFVKF